MECMIDVALS